MEYCGIDLASKSSELAVVMESGDVFERARIPTTESALRRWFGDREPMVICLEAGSVSALAQRVLVSLGHDVVVANPARVRLIAEATLKNDAVDAETLARLVRADRKLLRPITHRSEETQRERGVLRVRRVLVNSRSTCLHTARGLLRSFGHRIRGPLTGKRLLCCLGESTIPEELVELVMPLATTAVELEEKIAQLDEKVEAVGAAHPAVGQLMTVPGVGPVVALSYVLCIEDPRRFARSRDVAGFLGLRPSMRESGSTSRYGGITHAGDTEMRWLLIQAAHALLRSRVDSDLKRWTLAVAARVGKKKAIVGLARKLAVVMHTMWISGEEFRPLRDANRAAA